MRLTRFEKVEILTKSKKPGDASKTDENGSETLQDAENSARDLAENVEETLEDRAETEPQNDTSEPSEPVEAAVETVEPAETVDDAVDGKKPTDDQEPAEPDAHDKDDDVSEGVDGEEKSGLETGEDAVTERDDASEVHEVDAEKLDAETAETDDSAKDKPDDSAENSDVVPPEPEVEDLETVEQKQEPKPQVIRETQVVKGSIWPGVFGGVIAAVVGFVAGRGDMLDTVLPASMQRPAIDMSAIDAVTEQAAALSAQTEDQAARIAALEAAPTPEPVSAEPGVAPEELAAISAEISSLVDRIDAVEANPPTVEAAGASEEALAALASVTALEAALAEQTALIEEKAAQIAELNAAVETAEANAESEAARILARAALARVEVAVDSGEPYDTALQSLEEVTPVEVPEPLKAAAEAGVPTMAELQAAFPDAARAGLAAARAEVPESEVVGVTGFIRRQLNVRSTVPREGSDPDAVLSRAEAAVRAGDISTALAEIDTLPEAARSAMNDWLEAASARNAAQDAARALADSLSSN